MNYKKKTDKLIGSIPMTGDEYADLLEAIIKLIKKEKKKSYWKGHDDGFPC